MGEGPVEIVYIILSITFYLFFNLINFIKKYKYLKIFLKYILYKNNTESDTQSDKLQGSRMSGCTVRNEIEDHSWTREPSKG